MNFISSKKRIIKPTDSNNRLEVEVHHHLRRIFRLCSKEVLEICNEYKNPLANTINVIDVKEAFVSKYTQEMLAIFEDIMKLTDNQLISKKHITERIKDAVYTTVIEIQKDIGHKGWVGVFDDDEYDAWYELPLDYAKAFNACFADFIDSES